MDWKKRDYVKSQTATFHLNTPSPWSNIFITSTGNIQMLFSFSFTSSGKRVNDISTDSTHRMYFKVRWQGLWILTSYWGKPGRYMYSLMQYSVINECWGWWICFHLPVTLPWTHNSQVWVTSRQVETSFPVQRSLTGTFLHYCTLNCSFLILINIIFQPLASKGGILHGN